MSGHRAEATVKTFDRGIVAGKEVRWVNWGTSTLNKDGQIHSDTSAVVWRRYAPERLDTEVAATSDGYGSTDARIVVTYHLHGAKAVACRSFKLTGIIGGRTVRWDENETGAPDVVRVGKDRLQTSDHTRWLRQAACSCCSDSTADFAHGEAINLNGTWKVTNSMTQQISTYVLQYLPGTDVFFLELLCDSGVSRFSFGVLHGSALFWCGVLGVVAARIHRGGKTLCGKVLDETGNVLSKYDFIGEMSTLAQRECRSDINSQFSMASSCRSPSRTSKIAHEDGPSTLSKDASVCDETVTLCMANTAPETSTDEFSSDLSDVADMVPETSTYDLTSDPMAVADAAPETSTDDLTSDLLYVAVADAAPETSTDDLTSDPLDIADMVPAMSTNYCASDLNPQTSDANSFIGYPSTASKEWGCQFRQFHGSRE